MSEKKGHLSEAIRSVVEKTLHAATDASPHDEEYWYNLAPARSSAASRAPSPPCGAPSKPTRRRPTPWTAPANATKHGIRTAACSKT